MEENNNVVFTMEDLMNMTVEEDMFMLEESSLCAICSYTCQGGTKITT